MSAYFSNLASQQDALQTQYLMNSKLNSYESSDHLPQNMMYLNNTSASSSNPELFSGHDSESREEMMFIAPLGNPVMMQNLSFAPNYSDSNSVSVDPQQLTRKMLHFQNADQNGLSLSLGNQVASSYQSQYDSELRTAEYLSFDLAGPTNNNNQHHQHHQNQQMMSARDLKVHEETVISGAIYNSRYLKAAQELLDEVVNVHQTLRHTDKSQDHFHSSGEDVKAKSDELSPAEKTELQNKMTKLLSMLEEVDRRYKQYCQQMQVIVASFEIVAGCGAGKSYTALARQTISRQFRSLRDSIKNQIQAVQQSLGEEGTGTNTNNQVVGISRLRYIDQQLRQQRALLQFGVMRQPWRPQRGLPETAVSVLRAWLFEHFLHPYPKDSEKIMLARQTGLTRGQVANWFINARVRLWKPMIEEMYKEEFADMEAEAKSSQEHVEMLKPEFEEKGKSRPDFTARLGIQSGIFDDDQGAKMDNAYNFSMLGNQVSLALGLKHPMKGTTHSDEDDKVVDEADEKAADFYCLQDAMNQQERFSSPHLLSDFVL